MLCVDGDAHSVPESITEQDEGGFRMAMHLIRHTHNVELLDPDIITDADSWRRDRTDTNRPHNDISGPPRALPRIIEGSSFGPVVCQDTNHV